MPFFSVVIPTYNRAGFILNTLDTVFAQTFQDFEVIVVDNCSTDNTRELLAPLIAAERIRFVQHDRNYERAKSRNTGMQHARGQYLTFLDSDDFLYPDCLRDAYDYRQQHPDKQVFHNLYELVNIRREVLRHYRFSPLTQPLRQISEGNFLSCIGVFISCEVYQNIAWDEDPRLTGSEDYEFWLRVLAKYPDLGRIEKYNAAILEHEQRTVYTLQIDQIRRRFEYFTEKIHAHPDYAPYTAYKHKIEATLWIFLANVAKEAGARRETWKYVRKALAHDKTLLGRRNCQSLLYHLFVKGIKPPKTQ